MKVLYVASEAVPFIKTGGLADVAGSLPKELAKMGVDARVILPKYSKIAEEYKAKMTHVGHIFVPVSWRHKYAGVDMLTKCFGGCLHGNHQDIRGHFFEQCAQVACQ